MESMTPMQRQTHQFIMDNPFNLNLLRPVTEPDGAGGKKRLDPLTIPNQIVRIIEQSRGSSSTLDSNAIARLEKPDYVIIAEVDCDIESQDRFDYNGWTCEIKYVRHDKDYEVWAEVGRVQPIQA